MARREFENGGIVANGVLDDKTAHEVWKGRTIHHKDTLFPGVAPDMWHVSGDGMDPKYKQIDDEQECRRMYLEQKEKTPDANTFRGGCKHFVRGTGYKKIKERFHVIETKTPKILGKGKYEVFKHRIVVAVRDENGEKKATSVIEAVLTPLVKVSQKNCQGFGRCLKENAQALDFAANDCRKGKNKGSMVVTGTRFYGKKLCEYQNETDSLLMKKADEFFGKYGLKMWVNNLRKQIVDNHGNRTNMAGGNLPWASLVVVSQDYGNESHVDPKDSCQGITIWHEEKPPLNGTNVQNWYFLFPDLQVQLEDGTWKTGVAIPLVQGTVITWDARLIRHCTAFSEKGKKPSMAWGTYFGNDQRVVTGLKRTHEKISM